MEWIDKTGEDLVDMIEGEGSTIEGEVVVVGRLVVGSGCRRCPLLEEGSGNDDLDRRDREG